MLDVCDLLDVNECKIESVDELRFPLINHFYKSHNYRARCGRFEQVFSVTYGDQIIAAARLVPQKSGCFLLRNLFVAPRFRHQGIASLLIRAVAGSLDRACYCYALSHLRDFYSALKFKVFLPEQVPADVGDAYIRHRERQRTWVLMGYVPA